MRQIKFRAWSDNESKMIFPTRITFAGDVSYCYVPDDDYEYQVETSDLMQATGLKDKNGKDIYEGDVLRVDWGDRRYPVHNIGPVVWDLDNACWQLGEGGSPRSDARQSMEVVGNEYENPELLKTQRRK